MAATLPSLAITRGYVDIRKYKLLSSDNANDNQNAELFFIIFTYV
jgi:hypothetical protein